MTRIVWTDDMDARILELRESGLSALRIGRELGWTKGVVIGRLYRLDRAAAALEAERKRPRNKPLGTPARLLDLDPDGCRWAVSPHMAASHLFCNLHRLDGFSYCRKHYLISIGSWREHHGTQGSTGGD